MADTDIGADDRAMRTELVWRDQPLLQDLAELRGFGLRQARMRNRERMSAETRHKVCAGGAEAADDLLEQHVAMRVAERVVHRLEAGQIDGEDRKTLRRGRARSRTAR